MKCTVLVSVLVTAAVLTPATPAAAVQSCGVELASHQGYGTGRDPNTVGAFRAVARLHARWIETDLFQTRNRVPLLIHQDNLFPSTRKHGFVSELTSYQIRRGYRTRDGSVIPKFGEGLRAVKAHRGVKMLVEIKRLQPWGPIARSIINNGMQHRVWIYSTSAYQLRSLHRAYPGIRIGWKAQRGDNVLEIAELATVVTQAPSALTQHRVKRFHNNGVTVIARRNGEWGTLVRQHVDAIMTNLPARYAQWCRL